MILTPTRELGVQIAEQIRVFTATMNVQISLMMGGLDYAEQSNEIKDFPHFIIATPGRLASLLDFPDDDMRTAFSNIKYLVLDEADRFVNDQCFLPDLRVIFSMLPKNRQTLMFSATISENMLERWDILEGIIGQESQVKEVKEDIEEEKEEVKEEVKHFKELDVINLNIDIRHTIKGLEQKYMLVPDLTKEIHLVHFLKKSMAPKGN